MSAQAPIDPLSIPWRPAVDDVAALLRARTKDASGNELGTFTDKTRPTDAEVELLITNGCAKVAAVVGWTLPPDAEAEAMHLAAIYSACQVELSYWPEQVRTDRSAFTQLWELYQYDIGPFAEFVAAITPVGQSTVGTKQAALYTPSGTVVYAYQWGWLGVPLGDVVNVGH